jgi:hypothetical protein
MYSQRMDLSETVPSSDLASTKYCLSDRKYCFLVFKPAAGPSQAVMKPITSVKVDLTGAPGFLNAEWLDPRTGRIIPSGQIGGESWIVLFSPIEGEAILFLWKPKPPR